MEGFTQGQSSCIKSPMYHVGGALYMGRLYTRSKFLRKISPCIVLTCYTGIILHVA